MHSAFVNDAASIPEGVVIRFAIFGLALATLWTGPVMAQDKNRWEGTGFVKSEARLPRSTVRSDIPVATAFVAADGKVQVFPADRLDDITGSIPAAPPRLCNALNDLRPAELQRLGESIARDEGVPADLVAAILRIEIRGGAAGVSSTLDAARLTSGSRASNEDCLPAVTLRAGIRRLKDLATRYPERMHLLGVYHAGEDALLASRGVPTSPETLRFVAEVLNDLAGGFIPPEERRPSVPARRVAGVSSEPSTVPRTSPTRAAGDPRWASGFVLNIE